MEKDSSLTILSLGECSIDNQTSLYTIAKMRGQFSINTVFFYTKRQDNVIIIQLSTNGNEPVSSFCEQMSIVNSISIKPVSRPSVASASSQ
jgi:hypothetical protein